MVSAKVLSQEIDQNGNLKVATEYTLPDGSKTIGHTRYSCFNWSKDKILADIKNHCETLMIKIYNLAQNQEIVKQTVDDIAISVSSVEYTTKPAEYDSGGVLVTPEEKITITFDEAKKT